MVCGRIASPCRATGITKMNETGRVPKKVVMLGGVFAAINISRDMTECICISVLGALAIICQTLVDRKNG